MDHRGIEDLWDIGIFGGAEPRYERLKRSKEVSERFMLDERKRALGFPSSIAYSTSINIEPRRERVVKRPLAKSPFKVLDAPSIMNDYYLNLMDWSKDNVLSLGLSDHLYLWNARTKGVVHLMSASDGNYISGVSFSKEGLLAVGRSDGILQVYDTQSGKCINQFAKRATRIPSLAWGPGMLSAGAKDGSIFNYDIRSNQHISSFLSHSQEVCGLKWDNDCTYLASGSNDNSVCVWRPTCIRPKRQLTGHTAAVRALAWCPWKKGILSTGGGAGDTTIKTWDAETGQCQNTLKTNSQVCSLLFSNRYKELISTHGYEDNSICVWKYCTMRKIGRMEGHTDRVLFSALSPDGNTLATCAADENLNFWSLFEHPTDTRNTSDSIVLR
ncbi:cell division cycle 20, cofactor of APC complex [Nematocida sp. AWRm80]|nr:cell division cycle 20, cofactor of APC complex [Nematocida sp. AWRm80]